MKHRNTIQYFLIFAGIIPGLLFAPDLDELEGPYSFNPGAKFYYSGIETMNFTGGTFGSNEDLIIWTMVINPDLTYRLILEYHSRSYRIDSAGERTDYPERVMWSYCDVDDKGRFKKNYHLDGLAHENLYPVNLFIELPEEEETARAGWTITDSMYGVSGNTLHYKWNPDASTVSDIAIDIIVETPLDAIYLLETKGVLHYDPEYGLPISRKSEQTRGYGKYAGKTTVEIKLDSIRKFNPDDYTKFENSLYSYLEAESTYYAMMEETPGEPENLHDFFIKAKEVLDQTSTQITDTIFKKEISKLAAGYDEDTIEARNSADQIAAIIGQPAKNWKTKDINGKTYKSSKYKGKILLLDFWYRGCPWCMHSIPQLMRVFEKYKKEPVALLGMNVDKDINDARFVVEKMEIKYVNLQAGEIAKDYEVTGYPTFFIIDQDGIVRERHVGWSEDLFERISRSIDKLLVQ